MLLWVGSQANPEFVRDVFGVPSPQQVDTQVCELPVLDTRANKMVRELIEDTRIKRRTAMRVSSTSTGLAYYSIILFFSLVTAFLLR